MGYKWKPNASQRREFAQRMADPDQRADYEASKRAREDKRRAGSQFDYGTAGGNYVPTMAQYDCAMSNMFEGTPEQQNACMMVQSAYVLNEKCHHDYIHIVNEIRRSQAISY